MCELAAGLATIEFYVLRRMRAILPRPEGRGLPRISINNAAWSDG
jgi:hypothetical protein